ncbi:unnamed protein product [Peniophora sp. CBMAI 1063]|nr:unnamed protein product [Peniophora sp. CBMAI 1063]
MVGGKDHVLNTAQVDLIASILVDEFDPYIREHDPGFSGFPAVSQWVARRKKDIVDNDPIFATEEQSRKKLYMQLVDRKFRNFYHGLRERESPLSKALLKLLIPRTTALHLFELEVKQELDDSGKDPGEGYQTRLRKRWDSLPKHTRKGYEQQVDALAKDIEKQVHSSFLRRYHADILDSNRDLLFRNLNTTLEALCQEKALGGLTAIALLGYRDIETGEIQVKLCDGRMGDESSEFGADKEERAVMLKLIESWKEYTKKTVPSHMPQPGSSISEAIVIPRNDRTIEEIVIPRNGHGIPVFPALDPRNVTPSMLEEIIVQYYNEIWDVHSPLSLPWDDLVQNAANFYDVDRYSFMCFNREELKHTGLLYSLAAVLEMQCGINAHEPFTFRPASDAEHGVSDSRPTSSLGPTRVHEREKQYQAEPAGAAVQSTDISEIGTTVDSEPQTVSASERLFDPVLDARSGVARLTLQTRQDNLHPIPQAQDHECSQPHNSVRRHQKRLATVEKSRPAGDRLANKANRKAKTDHRAIGVRKTLQRRGRTERVLSGTGSAATLIPVQGEKDTFFSQGYKFKLAKGWQHSWHISLNEYAKLGGKIVGSSEFNDREEVLAMTMIARDPEWMASQWEECVVSRP